MIWSITHLSYGRSPHLWAALFTSHVTFSTNVQRNMVATNQAFFSDSFQKYHGTIVGITKHSNGIK